MADRIQSYKVISAGGLNSNENHLDLAENAPGSATRLVNYETSLFGGYRRINGFAPYDSQNEFVNPSGAEGKILCVALFKDDLFGTTYPICAEKIKGPTLTHSIRIQGLLAGCKCQRDIPVIWLMAYGQ